MKAPLFTLTEGCMFRFLNDKTLYKTHSFDVSDENGVEVEYVSFLNEKRFISNGFASMAEVEIISINN
jgi:hypothetical protein